jgi:hypothetical protein
MRPLPSEHHPRDFTPKRVGYTGTNVFLNRHLYIYTLNRPSSVSSEPLKSVENVHLENFISEKYRECSFWTPGSVLTHENMDKNENFLIQSIVFSDIKILRGPFWSPY